MPESSTFQQADPRDVESIDAIIAAAYHVISGPAGQKRDWNRERSLFYPGARIMPTASVPGRNDVELEPQMLDVEKYIARAESLLQPGFYKTLQHFRRRLRRVPQQDVRVGDLADVVRFVRQRLSSAPCKI